MEPASKKKKVEPIVEAIEKLEKLDMTYHPPSEEQLKDLFREFTAGLSAGSCLIGTEVEEEEYARMLEQDEESEIASGEEKQTVDDEMDVKRKSDITVKGERYSLQYVRLGRSRMVRISDK